MLWHRYLDSLWRQVPKASSLIFQAHMHYGGFSPLIDSAANGKKTYGRAEGVVGTSQKPSGVLLLLKRSCRDDPELGYELR